MWGREEGGGRKAGDVGGGRKAGDVGGERGEEYIHTQIIWIEEYLTAPKSYALTSSPPLPHQDGIDPTRREEYLTAPEFETVFGVSRETFKALPAWKRNQKKKDVGLF